MDKLWKTSHVHSSSIVYVDLNDRLENKSKGKQITLQLINRITNFVQSISMIFFRCPIISILKRSNTSFQLPKEAAKQRNNETKAK